jgi:GTPase SAR1 family protein
MEDENEFQSVQLKAQTNGYTGKATVNHKIVLLGDMGVGKTCMSIR